MRQPCSAIRVALQFLPHGTGECLWLPGAIRSLRL